MRWERDARGAGIGHGAAHAPDAATLLDALRRPDWVAEAPEAHLPPGMRRAVQSPGSSWTIDDGRGRADGVSAAVLTWAAATGPLRQLRAGVSALIGEIAESVTFVRQVVRRPADAYLVVTGMLDGDGPFTGHGHYLLPLTVTGPAIPALIAGTRAPAR